MAICRPFGKVNSLACCHAKVLVPSGTTLAEFIDSPGTATMVVDAFVNSHGSLTEGLKKRKVNWKLS